MVGISKRGRVEEGRPTKYKPEYCKLLIDHMEQGFSYETFVSKLPDMTVCKSTLYEWERNYPQFSGAKKRGRELSKFYWEKLGMDLIDGKIRGGSASAWIFVMKCRFGYNDNLADLTNMPTDILKTLVQQALEKIEEDE